MSNILLYNRIKCAPQNCPFFYIKNVERSQTTTTIDRMAMIKRHGHISMKSFCFFFMENSLGYAKWRTKLAGTEVFKGANIAQLENVRLVE